MTRRFRCLVFASLPLLLMAPDAGSSRRNPTAASTNVPKPVPALRSVELLEPGTVVDRTAPRGWTHLILKSQPRLPEDQKQRVNDLTARLATMVFTATTATVEAQGTGTDRRYRLARIGIGIGVRIGEKDVIVTPESQSRLGANLGLLARQVLAEVHQRQKTVRLVAVGPTVAIMDTPAFMPRGMGHAAVVLRYAFLVDSISGRLDTLVWRIDTDGRGAYDGTVGMIEWLPPNKFVDAEMQVDTNEFRLGIPTERAFAIRRIPNGHRQFIIPDSLRPLAGTSRLNSEQAGKLVQGLRDMIRSAGPTAAR